MELQKNVFQEININARSIFSGASQWNNSLLHGRHRHASIPANNYFSYWELRTWNISLRTHLRKPQTKLRQVVERYRKAEAINYQNHGNMDFLL